MMKKIKLIMFAAVFTLFSTVTVFAGTWECDSKGWWYQKETGSYPANTWLKIDNKWYYFNEKGYMQTGWIQSDEKWYYCGLNGGLVTDQWIAGKYYVGSDGAMYVNTTTPDGSKVDQNGVFMARETQEDVNYAHVFRGDFVSLDEYESYQWWQANRNKIMNDERIYINGGSSYEMTELAIKYYPELEGLYWTETSIYDDEFGITAEQGITGHGLIGGDIAWTGKDCAILKYSDNSKSNMRILDNNTIEIDGEKLIRIR